MALPAAVIILAAFQINYYNEGLKALDAKQYQTAADDFAKAIAEDPKDFTGHFNLAFALSMLNRDSDAIAEYRKSLELKPGVYQAELNLGILLLRNKQSSEAMPHLLSAVSQKPKEFRPNFYLAEALRLENQLPKAEDQFKIALALDRNSAGAELGLAETLAKEDHLTEAVPHFKKAAELDPHFRDALLELGTLYEQQKQPNEAIEIYRQFPENAGAQERIGSLLFDAGRYGEAVTHFEEAIKTSPTPANQVALAQAYIKNKQTDKAMPIVQQQVAAQPNDYNMRMLYGRLIRDQRKFTDAAQQFTAAAQLKPDSSEAWSELAGVLVLAENYQAAITALDKLAALHAEKPGHVYLRAMVFDKVHLLKPALESYQRFLAMDEGKNPDEDFIARQRVRIIQSELNKR